MLDFSKPNLFISTLENEINTSFTKNRLPLNVRLNLYDTDHKDFIQSGHNWSAGQNANYITIGNNKKPVAIIYSFIINDQQWFRFYIPNHTRFTPKETILFCSTLNEVFLDANLNGCDTNIARINTKVKIVKYNAPISIAAEWFAIPIITAYFTFLAFNTALFGPMMFFVLPVTVFLAIIYL